jgi:hypothetical protein
MTFSNSTGGEVIVHTESAVVARNQALQDIKPLTYHNVCKSVISQSGIRLLWGHL